MTLNKLSHIIPYKFIKHTILPKGKVYKHNTYYAAKALKQLLSPHKIQINISSKLKVYK